MEGIKKENASGERFKGGGFAPSLTIFPFPSTNNKGRGQGIGLQYK
jgi:hypothetical protein